MMPDEFFFAYLECAIFTGCRYPTTDGNPERLDSVASVDTIPPDIVDTLRADCADFWAANARFISRNPKQAGHDFHLTRNRHGAGFWDGDWPRDLGGYLSILSHAYGAAELAAYPNESGEGWTVELQH